MTTLLNVSLPQATAFLVPISYRGTLQNTLTHVIPILTSHNKPFIYYLMRSATEHSSTCKAHSHKTQVAYISNRGALLSTILHVRFNPIGHNKNCKYKLQKSVPLRILLHVCLIPQATKGLVPISYNVAPLSSLQHVSLISMSHNRPSANQLRRSATEQFSTFYSHSYKAQQA
jgi:hypothetical protein